MTTVETAVGVLTLLTVLALGAVGLGVVVDHLRCVDAAREAARLVSRGDQRAQEAAHKIVPGAVVTVHDEGDAVVVEVERRSHGFEVRATAFAVKEPA